MPSLNRVVMNRTCRGWIRALGPEGMDAAEISGIFGRGLGFRSWQAFRYPAHDICKGPVLGSDGVALSFDIVLADQVWEHLDRPFRALAHVRQMLRPGGWFWLSTPFHIPFHGAPVDCSRWSARGLTNLLAEGGFDEATIRAGQWGNRAAALRNMAPGWPPAYRPGQDDLANEPDFPLVAWAMAQRGPA